MISSRKVKMRICPIDPEIGTSTKQPQLFGRRERRTTMASSSTFHHLATPLLPFTFLLLLLILLWSRAVLAVSSSAADLPARLGAGKKHREFDYFLLALQWPGTACKSTNKCCKSNGCCDSSVPLSEFTIHGLWANYDDGSWPSCCSQSDFDLKEIFPLIRELKKYWPSFSCSSTSLCHGGKGLFWAHEWEKHGTCMSPVIMDEYSYFMATLDLYSKYNITKILDAAGFVASNGKKYPLVDVVSTIENAVGASPLLVCSHGAVKELRLCFYRDLKPRDCVLGGNNFHGDVHLSSSCPAHITLPYYKRVAQVENPKITWIPEDEGFPTISGSYAI